MSRPFEDWLHGGDLNAGDMHAGGMDTLPLGRIASTANRDAPNARGKGPGGGKGKGKGQSLGPKLPKLPGGFHAPNVGTVGTDPGATGFATNFGATFNPKNDYEQTGFKNDPEGGYNAFLGSIGLDVGGNDAYGQWLSNQYQSVFDDYNTLRRDDRNQNLTFMDFLHSLGGDTPEARQQYWRAKYALDSDENKGISNTPYAGLSRWLALG